jgi:PAS domain S-box-containing protein
MNIDMFSQQVTEIHGRLAELYVGARADVELKSDLLLPIAFKELGTVSEELQVAAQELIQKNEELASTRNQVEVERQRYQELFDFMPLPYLVTDEQGKILEANRAAAKLLNIEQRFLENKLLINFISPQGRKTFRSKLAKLHPLIQLQEWTINLQPRYGQDLDVAATIAVDPNWEENSMTWRWILRDITEQKRAMEALKIPEYDPCEDRLLYSFSKGEFIPLDPQSIWLVSQGIVKLSTINESGEEVLLGLAGKSIPFGSSMTSLPTYQGIALTEKVQLVSISLSEMAASLRLSQILLPQINKRLRQTETFLAISGRRHVHERLENLLLFLKQEFGESIPQGTRLTIRLTHQDIADACCTTRVTITRLLGKLQKQGKIAFDSKFQIILMDGEW